MNTHELLKNVEAGMQALALAESLRAALAKVEAIPGFGTPEGISPEALATVRAEEKVAQDNLAATIAKMPD